MYIFFIHRDRLLFFGRTIKLGISWLKLVVNESRREMKRSFSSLAKDEACVLVRDEVGNKVINSIDFLSLEPISSYESRELVYAFDEDGTSVFAKKSLRKYFAYAERENKITLLNPITGKPLDKNIIEKLDLVPGCKVILEPPVLQKIDDPTSDDVWRLMVSVSIRMGFFGYLRFTPEVFWKQSINTFNNLRHKLRLRFIHNLSTKERKDILPPNGILPIFLSRNERWEMHAQITMLCIAFAAGEKCKQHDAFYRKKAVHITAQTIYETIPETGLPR